MEIVDFIIEYIANHWWASIVLAILWIAYEIAVRRVPTDSPYWSIVHMVGKVVKMIGKAVIKVLGENLSKKVDDEPTADDDVDFIETPKKKKRRFKRHE